MTSPQEIFDEMPERFEPAKAKGVDETVQFDLSGDNGGQWYLVVKDGTCTLNEGTAGSPSVSIQMSDEDFVSMTTGQANAMQLFMAGKVKLEGNLMLAQSMLGWFGI